MVDNEVIRLILKEKEALTDDEITFFETLMVSVDSHSQQTKLLLLKVFKTFKKDVGLKMTYTQGEVDGWLKEREEAHSQPNNNCRYFLNKFMTFMVQEHIVLKPIKQLNKKYREFLGDDEKEKIMKAMMGREWRIKVRGVNGVWVGIDEILACFQLIDQCALRKSEPLTIRASHFKVEEMTIKNPNKVGENMSKKVCKLIITGKGNKQRKVVISPDSYLVFQRYIDKHCDNDNSILFPNLNISNLHQIFEKSCVDAGFTKDTYYKRVRELASGPKEYRVKRKRSYYHVHDLRRSRATEWNKEGFEIHEIMVMLGHTDIRTTQRYINRKEEEVMVEWAEKIEKKTLKRYEDSGMDHDEAGDFLISKLDELSDSL